ncbi:PucR family transcriptional regulator ligand-binding domain-containing protein [Glutamicibacter arilaitensis]|uniref:PucR family transcriptional regulator n=1 Tax=Glutamicibacter arilaitensis TaxID=256701 RepID=UPI00384D2304
MSFVGKMPINRTDCPANAILTVEQLLQLPCVLVGSPQVIAVPASLKRHIGWAHVLENLNPGAYLRGHELVLTTGIGWGADAEFEPFIAELLELRVAALVLELGIHCPEAPANLIRACKDSQLPLILLHEPVAFVEITETLHQLLFSAQTRKIEAGGEVTEHFTGLMQLGAPAETVLDDCARFLGCPIVFEDSGFNLLRFASPVELPTDFFDHWQDRSRTMHITGNPKRHAVPVQIHGKNFGSLIAPDTASHPAGSLHVLTMAAIALGTELLRKRGPALWKFDAACELLDDLLNSREANLNLLTGKFEAAGFPVRHQLLRGFSVQLASGQDPKTAVHEIERHTGIGMNLIVGALHSPTPKLFGIISTATAQLQDDFHQGMHQAAESPAFEGPAYLGEIVSGLAQVLTSINQATEGCELRLEANNSVVFAADYPMALLTHELRHEPAVQRLPQQVLAPLLALEINRRDECLRVLEAYLASPTNRSQAATRCRLSRSVFYQRLALLESLLEADLNDARTLTILTLSLSVYRQSQRH